MKSPLPTLLLVALCLLFSGHAQEQHNSLAVDEALTEEAGPYYFISYGDSSNAFAKAAPLAEAMGLELDYDNETKMLTFSGYGVDARFRATSNVEAGLVKRSGVLTANGVDIASPMAIIVDGVSYVPIVPVAKAFDCDYAWHSQYRLITVNLPKFASVAEASAPELALPPFRFGMHEEFARVAIDLGPVSDYSIAVNADTMLITFGANSVPEQLEQRSEGPVRSAYYTRSNGQPALAIRTAHSMSADGSGFRVGKTASNTLYIDFAANLESDPVALLLPDSLNQPTVLAQNTDLVTEPLSVAPAPARARPVVVIDAGHGGRFAGARHGNAKEEEIVLRVALAAKALLEARGVEVVLTRDKDVALAGEYRADLQARAAFATPERNLFVSIHANAASSRKAHGIETFVFGQPLEPQLIDRAIEENGGGNESLGRALTDEALRVANTDVGRILRETQLNYSRRLAHSVQENLVRATGAPDRGVKQMPLFVIRNARTPAILVELGFVTHAEEGRKLTTEAYQATLARALADGILEFLETGGTLASH